MGEKHNSQNSGIKLLVEKYRKEFCITENLDHYSEENYKTAERKFLKFALSIGDAEEHRDALMRRGEKKGAGFFDKKDMVM